MKWRCYSFTFLYSNQQRSTAASTALLLSAFTWAAVDAGGPVGFAALKIHTEFAAELYVTGILPAYHRQGIGRELVAQCAAACCARGLTYLTVKTLDASAHSECYDHTRAFYRARGFVPLEVFPTRWDAWNPSLLMVKAL